MEKQQGYRVFNDHGHLIPMPFVLGMDFLRDTDATVTAAARMRTEGGRHLERNVLIQMHKRINSLIFMSEITVCIIKQGATLFTNKQRFCNRGKVN